MNLSAPLEGLVPGLRGRVLTVLVRSPRPLAGREVARRVGTTGHASVKRVLQDLVDEGVAALSLASSSGQFFELNREHLLYPHLVSIDEAKATMMDLVRQQVGAWPREPRAVVLFGSVARHEDTSSSDIDLLVVWKGGRAPSDTWASDKVRLVEVVHARTGNVVNIMEFSGPDWKAAVAAKEPLVAEIARDGVSLMGTSVRNLTALVPAGAAG